MFRSADRHMTQEIQFTPDSDNQRLLRDAFGRFATGVTVVTVNTPDGPAAITANSFSSVSMEPPLVLWSASREARRFSYFEQAQHFAVHILASTQSALCWEVAGNAYCLRERDLVLNDKGVPFLDGALARFECSRYATYDGGDHAIFVGKVQQVAMREDGDALAFFKGEAGVFSAGPT